MIFWILTILCVPLAIATVTTRHLLRSAIYLMGVLTLTAGYYLLVGADFIAGTQVLVYVGGIVVLLVFAVMLTHSEALLHETPSPMRRRAGLLISIAFFGLGFLVLSRTPWPAPDSLTGGQHFAGPTSGSSTLGIGKALLDPAGFMVPFEVISLLLLAVLIAGVVLARKEEPR